MTLKTETHRYARRSSWFVFALAVAACTNGSASGPETKGGGAAPGDNPPTSGSAGAGAGASSPANAGSSGSGTSAGGGAAPVAPFAPVPSGMARLTATQFANSLKVLLGSVTLSELDDDSYIGGFATTGANLIVTSENGVSQYQTAIDGALAQVFSDPTRRQSLVGCQPKTPLDAACAQTFVKAFGRLAWRKSLTQAQLDRYTTLAVTSGAALSDPWAGLQWAA